MKNRHSIIRIALFWLLMVMTNIALSQTTENCDIKITSPSIDGAKVEIDGAVAGTATIPDGYYLWVLVHRILPYKKQGVWWPQSDADINEKGEWSSWVTYGEAKDVGHEFEIAIIVVDKTEHLKLQAYVNDGDFTKNRKMPPTKCPPVYRTVRKN
jgi:hypothetical protein